MSADGASRTSGPPARVRVTGPRTGRRRATSIASEIDARTELGEVYMRSLVRSQLRLALGTVVVLAGTLGILPLLFAVVPTLRHLDVVGVPLAWPVLGVAAYPLLVGLAISYVRRTERNEAAFRDLVRSEDPPVPPR